MKVIYCNELIDIEGKSMFLAGPIPRNNNAVSWKNEAIDILRELKFDGTVFVPEKREFIAKSDYIDEIDWDLESMNKSDLIVFWIPRKKPHMLGLTTNVEFGYFINKKNICYGRPEDSDEKEYLDKLYKLEKNDLPCVTLKETLEKSIKILG